MGREIKRVPMDFDWPLDEPWTGYCVNVEWNRYGTRLDQNKVLLRKWHDWFYEHKIEPPAGDGWQVWETVSEGSPISPVFATDEECIQWLVAAGDRGGGYSEAGARAFVAGGWAPSLIGIGGKMYSGIDGLAKLKESETP